MLGGTVIYIRIFGRLGCVAKYDKCNFFNRQSRRVIIESLKLGKLAGILSALDWRVLVTVFSVCF